MYSLNELQSLMRKAIIGAGYDTGIAEDISRAGVWLCQHGLHGADQVLEVIQNKVHKVSVELDDDGNYTLKDICVLSCGPSILDMLISQLAANNAKGNSVSKLYLKTIDNPFLLIALVANTAQENNVEIDVCFLDCESIVFLPTKVEISEIRTQTDKLKNGTDAVITCNNVLTVQEVQKTVESEIPSIFVSEKTLQGLSIFAAQTYVPASEASRLAGAGAGLTDND